MNQSRSGIGFFLTGNNNKSQATSRPISQAGSQIVSSSKLQPIDLNLKLSGTQIVQNEYERLQQEQEDYDKINELELQLMDLSYQIRHDKSDIESIKSARKLDQFIGDAEIKKLQTISKFTIDHLKSKIERTIGESQGWDSHYEKQITIMKKENEVIRIHITKLNQRTENLEQELGY